MPIVQVSLLAGRDEQTLMELADLLTDATARALGSEPDRVRVLITEVPKTKWSVGGRTIAELEAENVS